MAEMIRQTITELGGNGTLIETGGNPFVNGMIDNGAERTLTLYNHYDVVPPEPYDSGIHRLLSLPLLTDGCMHVVPVTTREACFHAILLWMLIRRC